MNSKPQTVAWVRIRDCVWQALCAPSGTVCRSPSGVGGRSGDRVPGVRQLPTLLRQAVVATRTRTRPADAPGADAGAAPTPAQRVGAALSRLLADVVLHIPLNIDDAPIPSKCKGITCVAHLSIKTLVCGNLTVGALSLGATRPPATPRIRLDVSAQDLTLVCSAGFSYKALDRVVHGEADLSFEVGAGSGLALAIRAGGAPLALPGGGAPTRTALPVAQNLTLDPKDVDIDLHIQKISVTGKGLLDWFLNKLLKALKTWIGTEIKKLAPGMLQKAVATKLSPVIGLLWGALQEALVEWPGPFGGPLAVVAHNGACAQPALQEKGKPWFFRFWPGGA